MFKKESTKLRVLRALVPYVPRAPRALVPYVFLCFMYHVPHVVLSYLIPVSCLCLTLSYVLLYFTCLALCMFSGYSCLRPFLLLCSSFLTCFRCYIVKYSCAFPALKLSCSVLLALLVLQLSEFFTVWAKVNHCDRQQQI